MERTSIFARGAARACVCALWLAGAGVACAAPSARPVPVNGAGALDRGTREEVRTVEATRPVPVVEAPAPASARAPGGGAEGATVTVARFVLEGRTAVSEKRVQRVLAPYLGRPLTLPDLGRACEQVSGLYRARGYFLARAYLPAQDIRDGVVRIVLVEGCLGQVKVSGLKHYRDAFVTRHFDSLSGRPLRYQDLLRKLLIVNEYPDLAVRSSLERGAREGTTDMALEGADARPLHLAADYNNSGAPLVSRDRFGLSGDAGNFLLPGDRLTAHGVVGNPYGALAYADGGYMAPVGYSGLRVGGGFSHSNFVVGQQYAPLDIRGDTDIAHLDATYPFVRGERTSVDLALGFDAKEVHNEMLGEQTSRDRLRVARAGVSVDRADSWAGRTQVSAGGAFGIPDFLGGMAATDPLASRAGAGGRFSRYSLDVRRIQQLWRTMLILKASGQWSRDVLPSSEQFAVGGVDTVRGFAQSQFMGDEGMALGAELRTPPPWAGGWQIPWLRRSLADTVQLRAFVEHGSVRLNSPQVGQTDSDRITGAGAGVLLFLPGDFNASCDVGFVVDGPEGVRRGDSVVYVQASKKLL